MEQKLLIFLVFQGIACRTKKTEFYNKLKIFKPFKPDGFNFRVWLVSNRLFS